MRPANEMFYEKIMLNTYDLVDLLVGEKREFDAGTKLYLDRIHEVLIDALDLPEDHHL